MIYNNRLSIEIYLTKRVQGGTVHTQVSIKINLGWGETVFGFYCLRMHDYKVWHMVNREEAETSK